MLRENMAPSLLQSLCRGFSCSGSLPQTCADVSAAPKFDYSNSQSRSILNAPPLLQVLSGARENALVEYESTLQSSRGGYEHLEVLKITDEGYRSVWDVCLWLLDRITFCWCNILFSLSLIITIYICNAIRWPDYSNGDHQPVQMDHILPARR
jgi:hypothetical protein